VIVHLLKHGTLDFAVTPLCTFVFGAEVGESCNLGPLSSPQFR